MLLDLKDIPRDELRAMVEEGYGNLGVWARLVHPSRFYLPFSDKLHGPIIEALDDRSLNRVVITATRGIGKTSLFLLAEPSRRICFRDIHFLVLVSCSATQAVSKAEALKKQLVENPLIPHLFGPMKSSDWSKESWTTRASGAHSGTHILPRGSGQQIRGMLYDDYRPDLILVDDLEDPKEVLNPEQRYKQSEWFHGDLLKTESLTGQPQRIFVIGTILHEDSLIANLMEDSNWEHINVSICSQPYFESAWPEAKTTEDLRQDREDYKAKGKLDIWFREMLNLVVPGGEAKFTQNMFKDYSETEMELNRNPEVETALLVDPAKTTNLSSAYSCVIGVSVNVKEHKWYVRDLKAGLMHPEELYENIFEMQQRLNAKIVGIESHSLHEFIMYPLRNAMVQRGRFFELEEMSPIQDKVARIAALVPFYRSGVVYHNPMHCAPLEAQLLSYPRSKRWDIMDALAYFVVLLSKGNRYFTLKEETAEEIEAEYKELEGIDDEPLNIDWRVV